ncbi:hypothetical protein BpHYR1_009843 [Brachionus plicatilis]|uniref:Uncharacterized protein n=1 Tax=Brachionus plicatilis TaxID=10195 RepID=A0A3M7SVN4_BRAPC|nr:hypothetical protein BpHYR1_009843 [Brachionus plicatilis]
MKKILTLSRLFYFMTKNQKIFKILCFVTRFSLRALNIVIKHPNIIKVKLKKIYYGNLVAIKNNSQVSSQVRAFFLSPDFDFNFSDFDLN